MMCPSGVIITPAPDPGAFGIRSCAKSRPLPVALIGNKLTTEGFADSASSVMTDCISSSIRSPLAVLVLEAGGSVAETKAPGQRPNIVVTRRSAVVPMVRLGCLIEYQCTSVQHESLMGWATRPIWSVAWE